LGNARPAGAAWQRAGGRGAPAGHHLHVGRAQVLVVALGQVEELVPCYTCALARPLAAPFEAAQRRRRPGNSTLEPRIVRRAASCQGNG